MSFTALPTDTYALVHDAIVAQYAGREWPEALVELHLRYLVGEHKRGELGPGRRQRWPTTRELGALVNWRFDRVARFVGRTRVVVVDRTEVVAPHWMDPFQLVALADLTGDRLVGANRSPTAARRQPDGSPTARTEEPAQSATESDGSPTAARRQPDAVRDLLRAGTTVHSTNPDGCLADAPSREAPPVGAPAPPPPSAPPPPEDLPAYLGLSLQAAAIALVRAGIESRTQLLACTLDDLRYTRGVAGATAKRIAGRVAEWGDHLADEPIRPNGRAPPGRRPGVVESTTEGLSRFLARQPQEP